MFRDREHAAHLLAEELTHFKNSEAVVMAIPRGGVPVALHLAQALHLPLDIVPSKRMKDPANCHETIGSVSLNGLDLVDDCHDIPQDYIYHQTILIKHSLRCQYKFYQGDNKSICLKDKTVLLVDDKIKYESQILACIRSLLSQQPRKIVVVTPVASGPIIQRLQNENYEVVSLITPLRTSALEAFYEYLPPVTDVEIQLLLKNTYEESLYTSLFKTS